MINSVRNTVLSILNKNNYGYLSPADFNLYAKQAQMERFEEYFSEYNAIVNKENARMSGTGYANQRELVEEMIDIFSVTNFLWHDSRNVFLLPSPATTGDDYFLISKMLCYPKLLTSGSITAAAPNVLIDNSANFPIFGVEVNDIVLNTISKKWAYINQVVSPTELAISANIFGGIPGDYVIIDSNIIEEAERVTHTKITMLNNSNLTSPTLMYPAYTQEGDKVSLFPTLINRYGYVQCQYIRYPKDPKWTYVSLLNGEPSFDQSQLDYQDFELPLEDEYKLVQKILQYAGISIREMEVYQFAKAEEIQQQQQQ
jgi:hypothetical protein